MGFMKKKAAKKTVPKTEEAVGFEVVMHNTTQVQADEKGDYCHALFQTDKTLSPADWQLLAQHAREGATFKIVVLPGAPDAEEKNDD